MSGEDAEQEVRGSTPPSARCRPENGGQLLGQLMAARPASPLGGIPLNSSVGAPRLMPSAQAQHRQLPWLVAGTQPATRGQRLALARIVSCSACQSWSA